jgi:hypothetical protein
MKEKILGVLLVGFVYSLSNKIGKDLWNARIICNKKN